MDELAHELLYMRQDDVIQPLSPPSVNELQTKSRSVYSDYTRTNPYPLRSDDEDDRWTTESTVSKARPPYYEHLGGYEMNELKDFNQYSKRGSTVVARFASAARRYWNGGGQERASRSVDEDWRLADRRQESEEEHQQLSGQRPERKDQHEQKLISSRFSRKSPCPDAHRSRRPGTDSRNQQLYDYVVEEADEATMYITSV
jgi:hypothetical protein